MGLTRCYKTEVFLTFIFIYGAELADQSQQRRTMVHGCWKTWVFSRRLKVLSDSSGCVVKEVDCSRLQGRTPRSSAGQWRSGLWAREEFQSSQSVVDAFPRLKWPVPYGVRTFRRQTFWSWLIFKPLGVPDKRIMSFLLILLSFSVVKLPDKTSMRRSVCSRHIDLEKGIGISHRVMWSVDCLSAKRLVGETSVLHRYAQRLQIVLLQFVFLLARGSHRLCTNECDNSRGLHESSTVWCRS